MSFASVVREELCRDGISRKCCARAEIYGILLFCNSFTAREIRVLTSTATFAARIPLLFRKAFKLEFDEVWEKNGKWTLLVTKPEKMAVVLESYGYDVGGALAHHINFAVLEEDHCRMAFLRGVFLAGGSVSDPEKSYHLELATSHYNVSRELAALLPEVGFTPKQTTRNSNYLTYFKTSEVIEDVLTALGAPLAAMDIMNAKAEKDIRGGVNRRVNCDAANLDKAVEAAQGQIEAIYALERRGLLQELPDKLKEAVDLRMAWPELTLTELAQLCNPPITKSAFNHRLRKLMELAGK